MTTTTGKLAPHIAPLAPNIRIGRGGVPARSWSVAAYHQSDVGRGLGTGCRGYKTPCVPTFVAMSDGECNLLSYTTELSAALHRRHRSAAYGSITD